MSYIVNDFSNTAKWQPNISNGGTVSNFTPNSFQTNLDAVTTGQGAGLVSIVPQDFSVFDVGIIADKNSAVSGIVVSVTTNGSTNYQLGILRVQGYGVECVYGGGFDFIMPDPVPSSTPAEMRVTLDATGTVTWYYNGVAIHTNAGALWASAGLTSAYVLLVAGNTMASNQIIGGTNTFTAIGTTPPPTPLAITVAPLTATLQVNQSQVFTATPGGGTVPYTVNWINNADGSTLGTGTTLTFQPSTAGTYNIYAHVTDNTGLTASSAIIPITVTAAPPAPLAVSVSPVSANLAVNQQQIFTAAASGGTPPYTISWIDETSGSNIGTGTTYTFQSTTAGNFNIHASVTDNNGLTASSPSIQIVVSTTTISGTTPWAQSFPPGTYEITMPTQFVDSDSKVWNFQSWEDGTTNPIRDVVLTQTQPSASVTATYVSIAAITVAAGANGSVSPSGAQTLTVGQTYQYTATPDSGFQFDHWDLQGQNIGSTNPLPLTITAAMNGQTLTALFTQTPPQQITIYIATNGNGTVNLANGSHTFNVGDSVTFTATPATGNTFKNWTLNGTTSTLNPAALTIVASMNGLTLTANFTSTPTTSAGRKAVAAALGLSAFVAIGLAVTKKR